MAVGRPLPWHIQTTGMCAKRLRSGWVREDDSGGVLGEVGCWRSWKGAEPRGACGTGGQQDPFHVPSGQQSKPLARSDGAGALVTDLSHMH